MSGLVNPSLIRVEERKITFRVYDTRDDTPFEHVLVLFHGCGFTSQTFGAMVSSFPRAIRVVAFDARGHGGTICDSPEDDTDLDIDTLVEDAKALINIILKEPTEFVLCGHSMGGAVAARIAALFPKQCKGLIVIDAVEGVALANIEHGEKAAAQIPQRFRTKDDAVKYAVTTSHHGFFSASISTPDRLVEHPDGGFTWRTNILASSKYWRGWFTGLSKVFLDAPCLKLLLLAGVENLDTPLAAGHMQGKYQLEVLPSVRAGHFVQEDAPGQTATLIGLFLSRVKARTASQKPGGLSAKEVMALSAKLRAQGATRPPF